jgi:hypothetical protein
LFAFVITDCAGADSVPELTTLSDELMYGAESADKVSSAAEADNAANAKVSAATAAAAEVNFLFM